jgi:7 transmembrane receptor (Secretin family)
LPDTNPNPNQTTSSASYATKYINDDFLNFTSKQSSETDYEDYDLAKALLKEEIMARDADDVISTSGEKSTILTAILAAQNSDLYPDPDLLAEKLWLARQNMTVGLAASASGETGEDVRYSDCVYPSDRGHDFIDSIMYIYHGTTGNGTRNDLGGYILVIGSVFAFAAQLLTIIVLWLKNRRLRRSNAFYPIAINFLIMAILSNFFFIIGVQASKNRIKCEMVAILLHYLHLTTSLWCLIYIYIIFDVLTNECGFKLRYNYLLAYGAPAVYVMVSERMCGEGWLFCGF